MPITLEAADTESPVDLAISDASAPGSASPGQYVSVSWVVTNVGTDEADASWIDAVYLSTDATLDTATDTPLATISTASQSPLPDGRGYIVSMDVFLPRRDGRGRLSPAHRGELRRGPGRVRSRNNVANLAFTVAGTAAPAPTVSSSRSTTARPSGRWSRT